MAMQNRRLMSWRKILRGGAWPTARQHYRSAGSRRSTSASRCPCACFGGSIISAFHLQQADSPSRQDQDVVSCCEQTLRDATVRLQGMATEPTLSDIPLVLLSYESLRQLE